MKQVHKRVFLRPQPAGEMPAKILVYEPVSWSPHLPKIHYTHVSRSSLKYSRLLKYPLAVVRVGAHVSLMAYTRAGYTAACSIENNGEPSCQTPLLSHGLRNELSARREEGIKRHHKTTNPL